MNSSFFTDLDPDVYKTVVFFVLLVFVMRFILVVLKKLLDNKLKNKILEKGLSNEYTSTLLQNDSPSEFSNAVKWFLILFSTGIGLLITTAFPPLGIHSFAIVAISISIGFLAYSAYIKTSSK